MKKGKKVTHRPLKLKRPKKICSGFLLIFFLVCVMLEFPVKLHWYEAHGIGKRDLKIKRYLDVQ